MRCKLTEKTMSQPAAGGAAFRVRLIAFVPICMALAVHISSNRLVYFIRGHLYGYSLQETVNPDHRARASHPDPNLNMGPVCGSTGSGVVGNGVT